MLYVVGKKDGSGYILLVKAADEKGFRDRVHLKRDEDVLGTFTTAELDALYSSSFAVVSSGF